MKGRIRTIEVKVREIGVREKWDVEKDERRRGIVTRTKRDVMMRNGDKVIRNGGDGANAGGVEINEGGR